jgi:demethylmenaquinone methyltransferase/2-methoxy-6-polyprenyl-1,4-benzoquinol methylase
VPFAARGAEVIACDFSAGMLATGRRSHPELTFVAGDALRLPFADASFDRVTISFGLRNVADVATALRELARVAQPGGRLVILETAQPVARPIRAMNRLYTDRVMPLLSRLFSSDPSSYRYLADSARTWLDQQALADALRAAGWSGVGWRDLLFGAVAVHTATRAD